MVVIIFVVFVDEFCSCFISDVLNIVGVLGNKVGRCMFVVLCGWNWDRFFSVIGIG